MVKIQNGFLHLTMPYNHACVDVGQERVSALTGVLVFLVCVFGAFYLFFFF